MLRDGSRQALRRLVHCQKLFHGRRKNFQILTGRKPAWGPCGEVRGEETFLQVAGAGARTGEVSISTSPRATAGVRLSIGVEPTPFFRLNAVWGVSWWAGGRRDVRRAGRADAQAPTFHIFARDGGQASEACASRARAVAPLPAARTGRG